MWAIPFILVIQAAALLNDETAEAKEARPSVAVFNTPDQQIGIMEYPSSFVHRRKVDPDDGGRPSESFDVFDNDRKLLGMKVFPEDSKASSGSLEDRVQRLARSDGGLPESAPVKTERLHIEDGEAQYISMEDKALAGVQSLPIGEFRWLTVGVVRKGSIGCYFRIYSNSISDSHFKNALRVLQSLRVQEIKSTGFMDSFHEYTDKAYGSALRKAGELAEKRRLLEGNDLLLNVVPDSSKTAQDYFFLGNILFEMTPAKAMEFHEAALKLQPSEPYVLLEAAMSRHQNGRYEEAIPVYEAYGSSDVARTAGPGVFSALLAECLVRSGRYKEAVEAWKAVPYTSFRMKIAKSCFEMHGKDAANYRHAVSLADARKGNLSAAADTIALDCSYDLDWWNTETNREFLKADIAEFKPLFSADDPTMKLLIALADHYSEEDSTPSSFAAQLRKLRLIIGENAVLPLHGNAVSLAVKVLLEDPSIQVSEILNANKQAFENALKSCDNKQMRDLLVVWCVLLRKNKESEVANSIDRQVWEKTSDIRFAADLAAMLFREGKTNEPDFKKFIEQFPSHRLSVTFALAECEKKQQAPSAEQLGLAIVAEYEQLTPNPLSGVPTADYLNLLFKELEKTVRQQKTDPQ